MNDLCLEHMTADELWDYCMLEYASRNVFIQKLLRAFFSDIEELVGSVRDECASALEIGCGAGESSLRIGKMLPGVHFEASEYDARYVEKLKQTGFPYPVIQESVYSLLRKDRSFDLVVVLEVLEHLDNIDLALEEIFRVSNRYVLLSVPNEPLWSLLNVLRFKYLGSFGNTPGHINRWGAKSFVNLVSRYGRVIRLCRPTPWLVLLAERG